ncbi:MAG: hypothetical protein WHX93_08065 [bacterium]
MNIPELDQDLNSGGGSREVRRGLGPFLGRRRKEKLTGARGFLAPPLE